MSEEIEFGRIKIKVERLTKGGEIIESIVLEYDEEKVGEIDEWQIPIETILRWMEFHPCSIDSLWDKELKNLKETKDE